MNRTTSSLTNNRPTETATLKKSHVSRWAWCSTLAQLSIIAVFIHWGLHGLTPLVPVSLVALGYLWGYSDSKKRIRHTDFQTQQR